MNMCTTPKGEDYAYDFFMIEKSPNKLLIKSKTRENSFLTDEYVSALEEQYEGAYRDQELEAEFVNFSSGVIDAAAIGIVNSIPIDVYPCRFYDLAISEKHSADFTASCLGGWSKANGCFYIIDITNEKQEINSIMEKIINLAQTEEIDIGIEKAGQMEGYITHIARDERMREKRVVAVPPKGSKVVRAMLWASKIASGQIKMLRANWNRKVISQCNGFTQDMSHRHDDMVDAISGCYQMSTAPRTEFSATRLTHGAVG